MASVDRWLCALGAAACAAGASIAFTLASPVTRVAAAPSDDVSLFAHVPSPGHPFGVFLAGRRGSRRVYVTTSAGNPFHANTKGERLFEYTVQGRLKSVTNVPMPDMGPVTTMGLYGMAIDRENRLYVGDMNGRVLRYRLRKGRPTHPETYATVPPNRSPGGEFGWAASMWDGLTFDRAGNLYVADNAGPIWRIPPNGKPRIWFDDPRLQGGIAGSWGVTFGPDGKLYVLTVASGFPTYLNDSVVWRMPVVDHPTAGDLHPFAVVPSRPFQPVPAANALAFGKSGRIYLSLAATPRAMARGPWAAGDGELVVLAPNGREERRITYPLFDSPIGLTFLGHSLLVANTNFSPVEDPRHWAIFKVGVGEPALPEPRPRIDKSPKGGRR